jgi:hypothetical protein
MMVDASLSPEEEKLAEQAMKAAIARKQRR